MKLVKRPYKGTRDLFPKEKKIQDYIFDKMKKAAELYGYEHYDGPLIESVDLYRAKSGDELINEQIYSFHDRGEREVAIRPEMTPTLARMVAQVIKEEPRPIRWYSIPNLMRYERPQKGRLREHWQLNCDVFGLPSPLAECEVIDLLCRLLESFGANKSDYSVRVNDRKLFDHFIGSLNIAESTKSQVYKVIDQSKKIPPEKFNTLLEELKLSDDQIQQIQEYVTISSIEQLESFCKKNSLTNHAKDIIELINLLPGRPLHFDGSIVRGLDYYTGIVFEAYDEHPDNRRALCGGGHYADLLKIFGEGPVAGVGFGLGDVTLKDFIETHQLIPEKLKSIDVFLTFQDQENLEVALNWSHLLRNRGLKTLLYPKAIKIQKAISLCEKRGCDILGILGTEEISNKSLGLKNIKSREQKNFTSDKFKELDTFVQSVD